MDEDTLHRIVASAVPGGPLPAGDVCALLEAGMSPDEVAWLYGTTRARLQAVTYEAGEWRVDA